MKIHCDSDCRPCVLEGGPSRYITDIGTAHYCPTCRSGFLCDIGIIRSFSASNINYLCVECRTPLIKKQFKEIAMDKAKFLLNNGQLSKSGKYRPTLAAKKSSSLENLSLLYETKAISAFHGSLITELTRISGLTPQIISNFAREFGFSENILTQLSGDTEATLLTLAGISAKFIEILHSILIGRDPTIPSGLALRFSVYASNIANISFIQPSGSLIESGPSDLIAYDNNGMRIWIFCVPKIVDSKDLEKIVAPLLNQDLKEFSGVSEICIVTQKGFSWVAKQILRKYPGIVVTDRNKQRLIPFELWQEKVITTPPTIAFENIRF